MDEREGWSLMRHALDEIVRAGTEVLRTGTGREALTAAEVWAAAAEHATDETRAHTAAEAQQQVRARRVSLEPSRTAATAAAETRRELERYRRYVESL